MSDDGMQVSRDFERRILRMTTVEMRKCAEEWGHKIDSGAIPDERKHVAIHQLMFLRNKIEERRKNEPHPRTLRA